MVKHVHLLAVVLMGWYLTGCTYQAQPTVQFQDGPAGAIERVLVQDQNIASALSDQKLRVLNFQ